MLESRSHMRNLGRAIQRFLKRLALAQTFALLGVLLMGATYLTKDMLLEDSKAHEEKLKAAAAEYNNVTDQRLVETSEEVSKLNEINARPLSEGNDLDRFPIVSAMNSERLLVLSALLTIARAMDDADGPEEKQIIALFKEVNEQSKRHDRIAATLAANSSKFPTEPAQRTAAIKDMGMYFASANDIGTRMKQTISDVVIKSETEAQRDEDDVSFRKMLSRILFWLGWLISLVSLIIGAAETKEAVS
jgi:hypothetical protein